MSLRVDDETFEPVSISDAASFAATEDDIRVTLELHPDASWVAEAFPVEDVERTARTLRVTLAISSLSWLEQLLLQLGTQASIESSQPPLDDDIAASAAQRVLSRYRE